MTTQYTPNFRLNLPDFRMGPWHDLVNGNTTKIDQLLFSIYQGVDTSPWRNNTDYSSGQTALDETDNSFWVAIVDHTSAGVPTTFAEDRAAHPGYWNRVVVGIAPRGEWENDQHYLPNDMVSDSVEHVIGVCKTEHQSNATGTIRDDEVYWTFIADIGDTAAIAATVEYDNTASGTTATNLQDTTDELYASAELQESEIAANASQIAANTLAIANNTSRIGTLETSDAAQSAAITDNASDITNLDTRVTAAEGAISGHETRLDNIEAIPPGIPEAPSDGKMYARKNIAWAEIKASAVLVSDTPPVGADPNTLWWESDSGSLYINFVDADSTQWDLVGAPGAGGMTQNSVRFDAPQGLNAAQKQQALNNINIPPTITRLTGSGNYNPPTGCSWLRVRMVAAGGGGSGSGQSGTNGALGNQTTFGLHTATGGAGGNGSSLGGGIGGNGSIGAGAYGVVIPGNAGASANGQITANGVMGGGIGGGSMFGGGAPNTGYGTAGSAAGANTGGGGAGAGSTNVVGNSAGPGGGGGGGLDIIIPAPVGPYAYSVGASVAGGGAGTSGLPGGASGSGLIVIEEHYGS